MRDLFQVRRREDCVIRPKSSVQQNRPAGGAYARQGLGAAVHVSPQTTLARAVSLSGCGVHSGAPARLTLAPAAAGGGVVFNISGVDIVADWRAVDATQLRTRLRADGASVSTVEHLLAALSGLGVDNALVEVEGDEIPAMDGSAEAFVAAIDEAGVVPLAAPRAFLRVVAPVRVADGAGWAELAPATTGLSLDVEIAFGGRIGRQRRILNVTPDVFRRELARARSFGFLRDAERLWRDGLALGASLDNTVVLDGGAVLNPQGLRYADEFVRHKMLDVVGDLSLAGAPIIGAFRSYRGGHALNVALLEAAMQEGAFELVGAQACGAAAGLRASP
ncbi:UDP-3-O-acyl-N-acetylglucosamine deacetylase [Methylocystis parvus]|uniref:UDP-3-O-acyl-N-acetylglucosamine deacetylase n=1 Tax=Methylocystis parvus TaxID=134 RepID=A0A6B8M734_9HYPH|nr:UDP-3-O-acyl-N-acetylglucosamine deacetylase [Methylocystis parvus]QGM98308.1 UDP-3-O-[3-hydroxymyristoyl] N-acetylglucosamine deacetylase [Methylocystis parvus]WBK01364.1 UDP-3-O-acyl-N-acetylglucosamine deacetylase [Methylocystis parvus OBBP]